MAFTARYPVRFGDIDWARVVYFARFNDFAHRCFEDFFNEGARLPYAHLLGEKNVGLPIVHSEADFFAPLRLEDTVRVVMEVVRLTRRSVTSRFTLYRGDTEERCAVIVLKQASVSLITFAGQELPDDVYALFAAHQA